MTTLLKNKLIKSAIYISIVIFVFAATISANAQQINFSGQWKLNTSKSEFGKVPPYAAVKQFDIQQQNNVISIKRVTIDEKDKEYITSERDDINSKPESFLMADHRTKTNTLSWSEDGKMLTTVSTYSAPDDPTDITSKISQTWSISSAGEFVVTLTTKSYTIKAVYDKQ